MVVQEDEEAATLGAEAEAEWERAGRTAVDLPLTVVSAAPVGIASDADTNPIHISELPGFDPGFVLGRHRGIADALDLVHAELITHGTDAGTTSIIVTDLGKRLGLTYS